MRKIRQWMFAAVLVIFSAITISIGLTACEKAHAENEFPEPKVEAEELIRTSQSWDGVELPDYFEGRPELVAVKYVFPPGMKLGWHHHVAMNYGVLVQGELTIIGQDGKTKVVHEGEAVVEMVGTAGTITKAADIMKEAGANSVRACASHCVMSGPASDRVQDSALEEIVFTDSIPYTDRCAKVKQLSVADLFAETIRRVVANESISSQYLL